MSAARFLDVDFGDNDFGFCMEAALKRLWGYVNDNNGHMAAHTGLSVPDLFCRLHKHSKLEPLIDRLYVLEYLCCDVEYATRGLDRMAEWNKHLPTKEVKDDEYLRCHVMMRHNDTFRRKWQNGEHAYLELQTGKCETF